MQEVSTSSDQEQTPWVELDWYGSWNNHLDSRFLSINISHLALFFKLPGCSMSL